MTFHFCIYPHFLAQCLAHIRCSTNVCCGAGCHFFLQGIFPTQGSNPHLLCLLHCRQIIYHRAIRESPYFKLEFVKSVSSVQSLSRVRLFVNP